MKKFQVSCGVCSRFFYVEVAGFDDRGVRCPVCGVLHEIQVKIDLDPVYDEDAPRNQKEGGK